MSSNTHEHPEGSEPLADQLDSDVEYVEEEEEVTDNGTEDDAVSNRDGDGADTPLPDDTSLVSAPAKEEPMDAKKRRTPAVSDAVKRTISETPGASAARGGPPKKPAARLTLAGTGNWTTDTFSRVNVIFPTIGAANETTNDLTKSSKPENRYWKGDIKFNLNGESSQSIRIFNVPVPFADSQKYGTSFVYLSLPSFMAEQFAEAGKRKRATVVNEKSLVPDSQRWWRIANDVTDKFGVGDAAKKTFKPINIQTLFSSTMKGIIANVELKFTARCSTTELAKLTATNPQRVTIDLVRAYVVATDQEIELPARTPKGTTTIKPGASTQDYATDSVMKRLLELGL